jgi:hypothetical protein
MWGIFNFLWYSAERTRLKRKTWDHQHLEMRNLLRKLPCASNVPSIYGVSQNSDALPSEVKKHHSNNSKPRECFARFFNFLWSYPSLRLAVMAE